MAQTLRVNPIKNLIISVLRYGQKVVFTMGFSRTMLSQVGVFTCGLMDQAILENGAAMRWVGLEDLRGMMEENIRVNLRMECLQVLASMYGLMAGNMKVIIRKMSKKDLELTPTQTDRGTKVNGKTGFNMAVEKLLNYLEKKMEVFGIRDKRRNV